MDTLVSIFNPNDTEEIVTIVGHANGFEVSVDRLIPAKASLITLVSDLVPFEGKGSLQIFASKPIAAVAAVVGSDGSMINAVEADGFFATKNP